MSDAKVDEVRQGSGSIEVGDVEKRIDAGRGDSTFGASSPSIGIQDDLAGHDSGYMVCVECVAQQQHSRPNQKQIEYFITDSERIQYIVFHSSVTLDFLSHQEHLVSYLSLYTLRSTFPIFEFSPFQLLMTS